MSERGQHQGRGGRGGGRGGGEHRGGRGGGGHHGGRGGAQQGQTERPKKENILDLGKYMDKQITVKFNGGREGEMPSDAAHGSGGFPWLTILPLQSLVL
jgi:U6 snRNA-associated Sm-like protein LSm7